MKELKFPCTLGSRFNYMQMVLNGGTKEVIGYIHIYPIHCHIAFVESWWAHDSFWTFEKKISYGLWIPQGIVRETLIGENGKGYANNGF